MEWGRVTIDSSVSALSNWVDGGVIYCSGGVIG